MCGFVGVVHWDGTAVEQPVLARMAHAIAHRGPDGEGAYVCGQVGFYFKRLAIIDLVSGDQPIVAGGSTPSSAAQNSGVVAMMPSAGW